jgi:hypothetical protein
VNLPFSRAHVKTPWCSPDRAQGQVLVTPLTRQVPASQHAPPVHALGLPAKQSMVHVVARQVGLVPHDMSPVHSIVDASAWAKTAPGHAACAAHAIRHDSDAVHEAPEPH